MANSLLTLDTLDDRRELHTLLARLPPRRRAAYLYRCCHRVAAIAASPSTPAPEPGPDIWNEVAQAERCGRADDRLTNDCYMLIVCVAHQYAGLDLCEVAVELERYVRTGDLPPLPSLTPRKRATSSPRRPAASLRAP